MRKILSGFFLSMFVLALAPGAHAAALSTDNWDITVSETTPMHLDFAIEYRGDAGDASSVTTSVDIPQDDASETSNTATEDSSEDADVAAATTPESGLAHGAANSILINEFVSDPVAGASEWVELYNNSNEAIDLTGWDLVEGSGKATHLEGTLAAHDFVIVDPITGALNNAGDSITLLDSYGTEIDSVIYGNWDGADAPVANDPDSLGLDLCNTFIVMDSSPGSPNAIPVYEAAATDSTDADATDNTQDYDADQSTDQTDSTETASAATDDTGDDAPEPAPEFVNLADIRSVPLGTEVITEGLVSVLPGVLGRQYFYLAGSGIQAYMYSSDFPVLQRGMRVRLQGELTEVGGERRLKMSSTEDITLLGAEDAPAPHDISTSMVGEATEGWLVRLTGLVSSKSSGEFVLADSEGDLRVVVKSTTGIAYAPEVGDEVTVTGIVSETRSGFRLLPRDQQDILPRAQEQEDASESLVAGITSGGSNSGFFGWALTAFAMLALSGAGAVYYVRKKRPQMFARLFRQTA